MTNTKSANLKRKIKHYTPEIIVGATVVAGAVALVYLAKSLNAPIELDDELLKLPKSALDHMKSTGDAVIVQLCGDGADMMFARAVPTE